MSKKVDKLFTLTKSSNVQHSNEVWGGLEGEAPVDPCDHMIEEAAVNGLG